MLLKSVNTGNSLFKPGGTGYGCSNSRDGFEINSMSHIPGKKIRGISDLCSEPPWQHQQFWPEYAADDYSFMPGAQQPAAKKSNHKIPV